MKTPTEKAIEYCMEVEGEIHQLYIDAFLAGYQAANEWISVDENRPEYGQSVLVCRPNKYLGKIDIMIAKYHKAKDEGIEYGSGNGMGGGYCKTFKDYWSLPAIVPLNSITFWMPLPDAKEQPPIGNL